MRVFEKGNWIEDTCPICNTQKEGQVVLVALEGTQEGFNVQARQVHLDCLELWYNPKHGFIYQRTVKERKQ